ncbi:uncharacterized protein LOC124110385 isoform X3 [Haliotis rufescens]|uniref:uncharacterized protein LOC124110385 isoform X3 n=1 Tax=Haliotis rufescens TaxID=6454 RepID=UPI001EB04DCB|nr:uncharacterized protein LOC124110385 isoform X3 [Haliotis rufescens]
MLVGCGRGQSAWTEWFNTDTPYDGVEEETIGSVKQTHETLCPGGSVTQAECRAVGTAFTFKNRWTFSSNILHVPCNATGLVCRDRDQPGTIFCSDYEIRYLCQDDNDVPVYDGGFIAMAAGLSVIVPLICVLIVQLKRAKAERIRQENGSSGTASADSATPSSYVDPPPTYEQLFGDSGMLERYDSTTGLLGESEHRSPHSRVSISSVESQSDLSISTISGDIIEDRPIISSGVDNPVMDRVDIEVETLSGPRRFLGMHTSLHDLFSYNDSNITTPPPTYNEALEILKMIPSASRKISSVQT